MFRPVVATIPITPRHTPKLGLMLIPFVMDILSKKIGIGKVLALNVTGFKFSSQDIEDNIQGYLQTNSVSLQIIPDHVWRDDQHENIFWINYFFRQLIAEGFVVQDKQPVLRCPCGVVETLIAATNYSQLKKLYEKRGNEFHCCVCKKPLVIETESVYLFEIPKVDIHQWNIAPEFTKKEIINLSNEFTGVRLLISRKRQSAIPLWTGKDRIFLDVDFGWQLFLPILRRFGYQPQVLVGSHKNLFGCYLAMLLSSLIDKTTPYLVVPGYCITRQKDEPRLSSFSEWGALITRSFLACHCTFKKKEVVFDPSLLSMIGRRVDRIEAGISPTKCLFVQHAIDTCECSVLRAFLSGKNLDHDLITSFYGLL